MSFPLQFDLQMSAQNNLHINGMHAPPYITWFEGRGLTLVGNW